jgi:hypothetical protein
LGEIIFRHISVSRRAAAGKKRAARSEFNRKRARQTAADMTTLARGSRNVHDAINKNIFQEYLRQNRTIERRPPPTRFSSSFDVHNSRDYFSRQIFKFFSSPAASINNVQAAAAAAACDLRHNWPTMKRRRAAKKIYFV